MYFFSKKSIKSHFGPKNDNFWTKIAKKAKKLPFFGQKIAKRQKNWKKGIFDKQKVRLSVPSGIWLLEISSKLHFFELFKSIFQKIQYFFIFRLSTYISACFDFKIEFAMKKHVRGLIFRIFGWIKGRFTPRQRLKSS